MRRKKNVVVKEPAFKHPEPAPEPKPVEAEPEPAPVAPPVVSIPKPEPEPTLYVHKSEPVPDPEPEPEIESEPVYTVPEGKSISSKRGVIGPGQVIEARDVPNGQATLDDLYAAGLLIKS
jgi:hypothetical protein